MVALDEGFQLAGRRVRSGDEEEGETDDGVMEETEEGVVLTRGRDSRL